MKRENEEEEAAAAAQAKGKTMHTYSRKIHKINSKSNNRLIKID